MTEQEYIEGLVNLFSTIDKFAGSNKEHHMTLAQAIAAYHREHGFRVVPESQLNKHPVCAQCRGHGVVRGPSDDSWPICESCNGKGY